MSTDRTLTERDEGKKVVNTRGENVGRVVEVEHGVAFVDPDPDIGDTIMSKLGWGDRHDEDTYRLKDEHIEAVTDDEIRVRA